MYQKLINTLTQVDNTSYKCESVHYVYIFDIDTNERLGSPKRNPSKHKRAQMSTTKPKQARTKAEQAQMNPNEHEQNQTSVSESQTRTETSKQMETSSDEHEGQPVQPSRDKQGPANEWRRAVASTNEGQ